MTGKKEIKRIEIIVYGRVHGVSFRYYAQKMAKRLSLFGWVKNEPDGAVKVIAQGEKENIEMLLEWAKAGPRHAEVEKIETKWQKPEDDLNDFNVRY